MTDSKRSIHVPKILFAELSLGALAENPETGSVRDLPYPNIEHLRSCITELKKDPRKGTKTVDRSAPTDFPYRMVQNGFFVGDCKINAVLPHAQRARAANDALRLVEIGLGLIVPQSSEGRLRTRRTRTAYTVGLLHFRRVPMREELALHGGEKTAREPFPPWPLFAERTLADVLEPLRTGKVASWSGTRCAELEERWAAWAGAPHAVACSSGTAALHMALLALGVGPGDEVLVPSHTFISTSLAVLHAGAVPVFCDVTEDQTLDPRCVEAASDRADTVRHRRPSLRHRVRHGTDPAGRPSARALGHRGLRAVRRRRVPWPEGGNHWRRRLLQLLAGKARLHRGRGRNDRDRAARKPRPPAAPFATTAASRPGRAPRCMSARDSTTGSRRCRRSSA